MNGLILYYPCGQVMDEEAEIRKIELFRTSHSQPIPIYNNLYYYQIRIIFTDHPETKCHLVDDESIINIT